MYEGAQFVSWRKGNRLKRLSETEARGRIGDIYGETKEVLGLPYVDFVFQVFGMYPTFLELHWRTLKPVVESRQFFDLAERLRADAYTRIHSYFRLPNLTAEISRLNLDRDTRAELTRVVELCHYGRALLLLITAAQYQAFESPVGQNGTPRIPVSHPVFADAPILVDEESSSPPIRRIFDEVRRNLEIPFVPDDYRGFARWPEFLKIYWQGARTIMQSPVYEGCHHAVRETAFALCAELPKIVQLTTADLSESGMSDSEITSVVRITEMFVHSLSVQVLNVAIAKIGIEGGTRVAARQNGNKKEEAA